MIFKICETFLTLYILIKNSVFQYLDIFEKVIWFNICIYIFWAAYAIHVTNSKIVATQLCITMSKYFVFNLLSYFLKLLQTNTYSVDY